LERKKNIINLLNNFWNNNQHFNNLFWNRGNISNQRIVGIMIKKCKVCSKKFETFNKKWSNDKKGCKRPINAVNCSKKCSAIWYYNRNKKEKKEWTF